MVCTRQKKKITFNTMGKPIYKSKTFWVALATVCTGIGMYVSGEQNLQELLIALIGAVFGILRLYTNQPIE